MQISKSRLFNLMSHELSDINSLLCRKCIQNLTIKSLILGEDDEFSEVIFSRK